MNVITAIHQQAQTRPDSPAFIRERTVSYGELMRGVERVAGALRRAGVARGDVVALAMPVPFFHIVLTLAVAHLGAVSVALRADAAPADNEEIAERCAIGYVVSDDPGFSLRAPGVRAHLHAAALFSVPADAAPEMAQVDPDDTWRIGFSSGTTGRAKAMRFPHQGAIVRSHLMRDLFAVGPGDRVAVWMPPGLPFATSYWLRTLMFGGTLVGLRQREAALEAIRRHAVTALVTSTGNAMTLARIASRTDGPLSQPAQTLKFLFIGGASAAPALQQLLRRHICPNLHINYGVSEVGMVALSDPQLQRADPSCAGRILPWVEVQALDDQGQPLARGAQGRLRMRSPTMAAGYVPGFEDPAAAPAFRDGWFYSSDTGIVGADGLLHLSGRADDVINLGGTKFDPSHVESVLCEDPAVIQSAVLVLPGRLGQPVLVAAVVASAPLDASALRQRCRATLGQNMTPSTIVQMDSLPRNAAGKVRRDELAARLQLELPAATAQQARIQ